MDRAGPTGPGWSKTGPEHFLAGPFYLYYHVTHYLEISSKSQMFAYTEPSSDEV